MESGFNTNIRHRDVVFHVQTEDSGRGNPHIITHLYYGGTILASEKRVYAEHVDAPDLATTVRKQMQDQHREMLKRLRRGEFNDTIIERLGPDIFQESGEPTQNPATLDAGAPGPPAPSPPPAAFGEGIVSEKPLDELVLDYLVENARKRRRPSKP